MIINYKFVNKIIKLVHRAVTRDLITVYANKIVNIFPSNSFLEVDFRPNVRVKLRKMLGDENELQHHEILFLTLSVLSSVPP